MGDEGVDEWRELGEELKKLIITEHAAGEQVVPPRREVPLWMNMVKKMYGYGYEQVEEEYVPSTVRLGPRLTDEHIILRNDPMKKVCVAHVIHSRNELSLERCYNYVNSVAEELRSAYDGLDQRWDNDASFVRMMLIDGLFVLELIYTLCCDDVNPVIRRMFENRDDDMKRCVHDILLLQNQLPIHLLINLHMIQRGYDRIQFFDHQGETARLISDIIRAFSPQSNLTSNDALFKLSDIMEYLGNALNILDVYRRYLVHHNFNKENRGSIWNTITTPLTKPRNTSQISMKYNISEYVPPATKLDEAGITFKISASTSLLDIQFSNKTLILPKIEVDSYTKSLFLNLIAFEKLHKHVAKNEVTSYMYFMGCLVHGPEDVTLLQSHGIIMSRLPGAEVAAIFNRISKDISLDPELEPEIMETAVMVRERYNKLSNEWRKELFQTYLKSPWAIMSLVVAFLIFVLSILQTLYSILSYIHRK